MSDDQTLLLSAVKALKLDDDLAVLKALADMGQNLASIASHIDDAATAQAFLN